MNIFCRAVRNPGLICHDVNSVDKEEQSVAEKSVDKMKKPPGLNENQNRGLNKTVFPY